ARAGMANAQVVGGCDLDAGRRDRAATTWNVPVYDDFDAMLARANADVVIIGTPPDSHASYCLKSFAAGAHVICEKPFVSSLDEADRVIAAAEAAGKRMRLNHR